MAESLDPLGLPGRTRTRVLTVGGDVRRMRSGEACRVSRYAGTEPCDRGTAPGTHCEDPVTFLVEAPQSSLRANLLVCNRHLKWSIDELSAA